MSVSRVAKLTLLMFLYIAAAVGPIAVSGAAALGAQTDPPSTTTSEPRKSASGTTHNVTVSLLAIAGVTTVMGSVYFWYTIPSRRRRIADRRR